MARRSASERAAEADPGPNVQDQDPAAAVDPAAAQGAPAADEDRQDVNQGVPVFALCPGQLNLERPLDYSKAGDVKLYKAATTPFNRDRQFDIESAGLMQFMMEVNNRANEHGWTDPNHGLCIITVTEGAATEKYDLTSQYGCVSIDQVIASDRLALQPGTRKAQNSMMLYQLLLGCLSTIGRNKVMTPEYQRKVEVNGFKSGNVLLKIIAEIARPQTPALVQMLRNNITMMSNKMTDFGQDIAKFNAYVIEQIQGLAAFGQVYDNIEYHLLQAYDLCTDQVFHMYLTKIKDEHETGEKSYSYDQIMKFALNKFNLMVQKNEWNPGKGSLDERLLALEAKKSAKTPNKNKKEKNNGQRTEIKEIDPSRYALRGGNWINIPPKGGPHQKVHITRKTKNSEKRLYWCSTKNGGQCNPGAWRAHKPEDCRYDEIKTQREKSSNRGGSNKKGESLKAEVTIIKEKEKEPEKKYYFYDGGVQREPKSEYEARIRDGLLCEYESSWHSDYNSESSRAFSVGRDQRAGQRNAWADEQYAKGKLIVVEEARVNDDAEHDAKKAITDEK